MTADWVVKGHLPDKVRWVRNALWSQVVLGALALAAVLALASPRLLRGGFARPVPAQIWAGLGLSVGLAVAILAALAVLAVRLSSRRRWVRTTVLAIQVPSAVLGAIDLFLDLVTVDFSTGCAGLVALILSATVVYQLTGDEARAWFNR